MEVSRWLLPFTYRVEMQAIDAAVRLAEDASATLVAVSLISMPGKSPARGARLEHIQQSKDFLESVYYKASERKIPLERYEIFTSTLQERLTTLSSELCCDAIILLGHNRHPALLQAHEMKLLLAEPPARLLYIHLLQSPRSEARKAEQGTSLLTARQQQAVYQPYPQRSFDFAPGALLSRLLVRLGAQMLAWLRGNRGTERAMRAKLRRIIPKGVSDISGQKAIENESVEQLEGGAINARSTHLTGGRR